MARTLRLDPPEREHLYRLAEVPFAPVPEGLSRSVGAEVQGILDALEPLMAVVYTSRYDVLAANAAYRDLFLVPETVRTGVPKRAVDAVHGLGGSLPGGAPGA